MVVDTLTSNPEVVAIGGTILAIGSAAIYSHFTGNEVSVDTDGDGEDELTFEGDTNVAETPDEDDYETEPTTTAVGPDLDADELEDVTGIGPTRAETFIENGYATPEDLYYTSDDNLLDVDGIGPRALGQIRDDIGGVDFTPEQSDSTDGGSDETENEEPNVDTSDLPDGDESGTPLN